MIDLPAKLVSKLLIKWYQKYFRKLPWRETKDPYKIWLSEVILQQTRVEQGLPYYKRYVDDYPTVELLAFADEDAVMKRWQGLGYYSRARNLHAAAKKVAVEYNGRFPDNFEDLKSLKGVGDYTASAIASIAFNLPYAVVDGNVYRVLSRLFGIATPIDSLQGKKEFAEKAAFILDHKNPGYHNQAVMELGALICKPSQPLCNECPVNDLCFAFRNNMVSQFPVKEKKIKTRERFFNYLFVEDGNSVYLKKRPSGDIWQNLYDFPLIETEKNMSPSQVMKTKEWQTWFGSADIIIDSVSTSYVHKLTHQHIHIRFFKVRLIKNSNLSFKDYLKVKIDKLHEYPVPKPVEKILINKKH